MIYEQYPLNQAAGEAEKMTNLVGNTPSVEDYQIAHEVIQGELLDSYLGFDKSFFRKWGHVSDQEVNESAECYGQVLHNKNLKNVLTGELSVASIPQEVTKKIHTLIDKEVAPGGFMVKSPRLRDQSSLLAAAGITNPSRELIEHISCRTTNHLFRLLLPEIYYADSSEYTEISSTAIIKNEVCSSFAKDYLQYAEKIASTNESEAKKIKDIISAEGYGVTMFWTLAPYINDELKRGGLAPDDSLAKIGKWLSETWDNKNLSDRRNNHLWEINSFDYINTPQAHKANFASYQLHNYHLGFDERMPSHLFSRLYAKSITEQMMAKDGKTNKASH